ncbi:hypothetical protein [Mesoplasma coleopterae]|uniref:MOLPALP family lipoprotein n=1 Tax=Mesoplasma coleopterae TaxID=324078 RepID=A0A2K8P3D0_9MOLU|nr:hypothetical protein [Mesoplasma coleopterae]ATZ20968.1 hypothetical protein MCOLE_v1c04560 [Mesoplasma coleopterae]
MNKLKKIITILGATLISTSAMTGVVACTYLDTEKESINNKLKEVVTSTSSYFKGAILANSRNINGQQADKYIGSLQSYQIINNSSERTYMNEVFKTFLDIDQAEEYMSDLYKKDDFNVEIQENKWRNNFEIIDSAFNEIYRLVGVKFDPALWRTALPILIQNLNGKQIVSIQEIFGKIENLFNIFKDVNVPSYKNLSDMGVKTNKDLKVYFSSELTLFIGSLFGKEMKPFNFKDATLNYYDWNTNSFFELFKKDNENQYEKQKSFTSKTLSHLFNALFGINWYIQNFTTDEYNLSVEEIKDDNHIFSKSKTNIEIIKEVNNKLINEEIINAVNFDGILQFLYDLFSDEIDTNSYKLLRTFKILFQVDDDIINKNTKLDFDTKILKLGEKTLDVKFGDWKNNGKNENGALNLFFGSTINGIIRGLLKDFDKDGGIIDFLNSIGMGSEQISGVFSGIISSILSGIDMTHFFSSLPKQINGSLNNVIEGWNDKLFGSFKDSLKKATVTVDKLAQKYAWLVNNEGSFTNKFLGYLVNTDIRKLMKVLGKENDLPIELPKISLKQIINIKITKNIRIGDILSKSTEFVGSFINLFLKGAAPKLQNIGYSLNNTSLADNPEFKLRDNFGNMITIERAIKTVDKNLLILKDDKYTTTDMALAKYLLNFPAMQIYIPKEHGFKTGRWLTGIEAVRWIMGIGVELQDGTINNNFFRENTIMYSLSRLWDDETGKFINYIFENLKNLLKVIDSLIPKPEEINFEEELSNSRFSEKLISYSNLKNPSVESRIIYEINYSYNEIRNKYIVKLVLPAKNEGFLPKYQIEEFKKIN